MKLRSICKSNDIWYLTLERVPNVYVLEAASK